MPPALIRIDRLVETLAHRSPVRVEEPGRKQAAVAIILAREAPRDSSGSVLLIRRAERADDKWSGHMAFPGGGRSSGDADLASTARRETFEEVGVGLEQRDLVGQLDDIAPRTPTLPPITVSPFVFLLDGLRDLKPNYEVALARWVPLERLTDPDTYRAFEYVGNGMRMTFPGYHLEEGVVWGMTERILTPLLAMLGQPPVR